FAQTVTYKSNHASLKEIITEIRKQTGFNVLVSSKSISNITSLKVNFKNPPLTEVLDKFLAGQPLTYKIEDKTVLIEEKKSPPKATLTINAATTTQITGTVLDEKGETLP